jgi:DNA (cytosine-5)-methyltransferase 1
MNSYTCIELCAGAGGQALGLEMAGYEHRLLVDNDQHCYETLRLNRPAWHVIHADIAELIGSGAYPPDADLLAGGLPCPPFSVAGKQLGKNDERNLFPAALKIIEEVNPKAIMIENVRGFLDPVFEEYRSWLRAQLANLGYNVDWRLLQASDYGVPQLRPRVVIAGLRKEYGPAFFWPESQAEPAPDVGEVLGDLMAENGWKGAKKWAEKADRIAPTIVGGSKKHGGPDLGPTRARKAWAELGVDGRLIAADAPPPNFKGMPHLTVRMVARLQGFPDDWRFSGKKTAAYRQAGNAFPPPVACAVAVSIRKALEAAKAGKAAAV